MKLCVLFPGIGYHCDKPLLYYTSRLARENGYEVIPLKFTDFPQGAKGDDEKMKIAADHAFKQASQQLENVDYSKYEKIVFVGKSIGTAAALAYRETKNLSAEAVLLTPLEMTFDHNTVNCTAFHGTADQWTDTKEIERLSREKSVPLYEYPYANHSIETNDVFRNIEYLQDVLKKAEIIF